MEYVRSLRKRRNFTQEELAAECGCHPTTISQIESGRMVPSLELFARMVRVLKVAPVRVFPLMDALLTGYQSGRRATAAPVTDLQTERERRKPHDH